MSKSLKESNPPSLSFKSHDDAVNYANQLVEDSNRWLAVHNINLCQRYENLNLEVDAVCRSVYEMGDYHLVFRAVPSGRETKGKGALEAGVASIATASSYSNWNDNFVFVGVTKLVQGPEKVIPSFVWLKRNHQVKDFFGQILGLGFYSTLHLGESIPEREMRVLPVGIGSDSDSVTSLIKSGSHVVNTIRRNTGQADWHEFSQLDFVKILSSVSILFDDLGVWITFKESRGFPLKFSHAALGVFDAVL
jgi:hypothetical protein